MTPTLLLDYGLLSCLIFSYIDQIDHFGRKIATIVLNTFATTNNPFCRIIYRSKPSEWDESGVIPAEYKNNIKIPQI